jgi:hypothetical protein
LKQVLVAVLFLVIPSLSLAATADTTAAGRANSLKAGEWALQFAIIGDVFHLDEFAGGVSFKRHFSAKSAIRFGIEGRAFQASSDFSNITTEEERSGYGLFLSTIYQRYIDPEADANLYWGVGPVVGWDEFTTETTRDSSWSTSVHTAYEVGLTAALGIEWFATEVISFHAEYSANGVFRREESETEAQAIGYPMARSTRIYDTWSIATGGVKFGLSVYF